MNIKISSSINYNVIRPPRGSPRGRGQRPPPPHKKKKTNKNTHTQRVFQKTPTKQHQHQQQKKKRTTQQPLRLLRLLCLLLCLLCLLCTCDSDVGVDEGGSGFSSAKRIPLIIRVIPFVVVLIKRSQTKSKDYVVCHRHHHHRWGE